jgi:hypothetical protein
MKPTFAPLSFKKEEPVQGFTRKSFFKKSLHEKYTYFKNKELPVKIPTRSKKKDVVYTKAYEIPFIEFQPSNEYMLRFLVADDSGDRKGEVKGLTYEQKKSNYLNQLYSQKREYETAILNQQYLEWKSFYSSDGPQIKWTGEVTYYGSYILFNIALRFTPEFFVKMFFKSGMYQSKGGRFVILQFLEQILNIRMVKPYYDQLELLGKIAPEDLENSPIYQAFLTKMIPGFPSAFPLLQGTLAIAQSFFRERDIPFSRLFMKNLPALLASSSINFVTATFFVSNFGATAPIMVCQLASTVLVQFLSGQITKLIQVYLFADLAKIEAEDEAMLKRKLIEEERQKELDIRKEYVKIGIVGKDIDERIKMKFDWEGYFGKNIATFQDGLYKAWKTRGDAVPFLGSSGFNALLLLWGFSTTAGFTMFMTTNDFEGYQYATGKNINMRFMFDFLTGMLRSFRFFDGIFSIETLAIPVVQKLRNDLIRVFTELMGSLYSDMRIFVTNVTQKMYYTNSEYGYISRLQKQSMFAYYFFTAMENILGKISQISDPAFKIILENYLNLALPLSQNIVSNMFQFSIEDSLELFESMNLFFLQFGVAPMMTSTGQISFYDTLLRQCTKGRMTSRAQLLYQPKKDTYSFLEPGSLLSEIFGYFSIQIPKSFAGFEEKLALLPLPAKLNEKVTFLDMHIDKLPPPQRQELIKIFQQIVALQKAPAIFSYLLQGVSFDDMTNNARMKALFAEKMKDPTVLRLFETLRISRENQLLLTEDLFVNFAARYENFLVDALKSMNRDRNKDEVPNEYKIEDITGAKLDRKTMSRFADYFADEYSQYVTDLIYTKIPMFAEYSQPFVHSYSFAPEPGKVAYHDIVVSREVPTGEGSENFKNIETVDEFTRTVLNPGFLTPKVKIKKRGKLDPKDGKPVEDETGTEFYEFEENLIYPEYMNNQVIQSFGMLTRMGYKIYHRISNNGMRTEKKVAGASSLRDDFQTFFTDFVWKKLQNQLGLVGDKPKTWSVSFFEEQLYLNPSNIYYSPEENVLQIGNNTHFFYRWSQHAGLRNLIFPPGYGLTGKALDLDIAYRRGLLRGEYLDKYILYSAALLHNNNSMELEKGKQTGDLDALYREYERLGLRTMDQVHMFELFRGILTPNGPVDDEGRQTLLSGINPKNYTLTQIFDEIMSSIGLHGMFPDHQVAIFGSPGGNESERVIGTLGAAGRANSWLPFRYDDYLTLQQYYTIDPQKRLYFQRILAYTLHGWFYKCGNVKNGCKKKVANPEAAIYRATLNEITPPDVDLLGPEKNTDSLDILGYRAKLQDSNQGIQFSNLESEDKTDSFIIFLKLLYLITDEDGKISVPKYRFHLDNLSPLIDKKDETKGRKRLDKVEQLAYIDSEIKKEATSGKKKINFIDCLLKGNCYEYQSEREQALSITTHVLFQIDYYLRVLNVNQRILNGRGIENHEIYDGTSPYFETNSAQHLGQVYFNEENFMGIDLRVVGNAFQGSAFQPEFEAWRENIRKKRRRIILSLLPVETGTELLDEKLSQLSELLTVRDDGKISWKDRLTQWLSTKTGSDLFVWWFGTGETAEKKIKKFLEKLESPDLLADMIQDSKGGNELDTLSNLLAKRNTEIETGEASAIDEISSRITKVLDKYKSNIKALETQRDAILEHFDNLWTSYNENKSTADIPPLLPVEAYRPPAASADSEKRQPSSATGVGERPLESSRLAQNPSEAVREGLTLANELARAEKIATIQRLRNELSQSQSLAQIEDLRLKLMTAFLELFGTDSTMFGRLSSADLTGFAYDFGVFPDMVVLSPPEPKPFKNINPTKFESCARLVDEYELQGASSVLIKGKSPDSTQVTELDPYMACRTKGFLVSGIKNLFSGLFDISKTAARFGITGTCTAILTGVSTLTGAILGGIAATPTGPGILGGIAVGAAKGFSAGGTLSTSCGYAAIAVLDYALPRYVDRVLVDEENYKKNNLLLDLKNSSDDPYEKIQIYERYFREMESRLKNPETKPEDVKNIRRNLKNLFTFLLFESNFSGDEPGKPASPTSFTTTLFGTGKGTQFNYYPFFKPSLDQIAFLQNLGVFDFSKINKPEDLFTSIQGLNLNLNEPTLTVLFGQKYIMPAELSLATDSRPSYNVWYKIGETIKLLDDFDERNKVEGTPPSNGNLYDVLTGSADIIKRFFSGEIEEVDTAIDNANRAIELEEETEREKALGEGRKESRIFELGNFMSHTFNLIDSINLADTNTQDVAAIETSPLLVESQTMLGFAKKNDAEPGGVSGLLEVRLIGGQDDNREWIKGNVTAEHKIAIRDMFTITPYSFTTPYYSSGLFSYPSFGNQYERMFDVLDYVPKNKAFRTYDFFSPTALRTKAWIKDEEDKRYWLPKQFTTTPEEYNMETHGNFPPFFFCTDDIWEQESIQTRFQNVLEKFYVKQEINIFFNDGKQKTVYGWFLQKDIDTFARLQPPASEDYKPISLIDAVLNNASFSVQGIKNQMFKLFLDDKDKPKETDTKEVKIQKRRLKWQKSILIKMIFSTVKDSLQGNIQLGEHTDSVTGNKISVVRFHSLGTGIRDVQYSFTGTIEKIENIKLRNIQREKRKRKELGTEIESDLERKTIVTRDLIVDKLIEKGAVPDGLEEEKKNSLKKLLQAIVSVKLGHYFDSKKENNSLNKVRKTAFEADAPTLISIGRREINKVKDEFPSNTSVTADVETTGDVTIVGAFQKAYDTLMTKLNEIREGLGDEDDLDKLVKDVLGMPVDPLASGGKREGVPLEEEEGRSAEEGEDEKKTISVDDVFPLIQLSVFQTSVYCPNALLILSKAPTEYKEAAGDLSPELEE